MMPGPSFSDRECPSEPGCDSTTSLLWRSFFFLGSGAATAPSAAVWMACMLLAALAFFLLRQRPTTSSGERRASSPSSSSSSSSTTFSPIESSSSSSQDKLDHPKRPAEGGSTGCSCSFLDRSLPTFVPFSRSFLRFRDIFTWGPPPAAHRAQGSASASSSASVPPLPPGNLGLPFIGETLCFFYENWKSGNRNEFNFRRMARHGLTYRTHLFGSEMIALSSPAAVKLVLTHEDDLFQVQWPSSTRRLVGPSAVSVSTGAHHRRLRKVLGKILSRECLKQYVSRMDRIASDIVASWLAGKCDRDRVHQIDSCLDYKAAAAGGAGGGGGGGGEGGGAWVVVAFEEIKRYAFTLACDVFISLKPGPRFDRLHSLFERWIVGLFSLPIDTPVTAFGRSLRAREGLLQELRDILEERRSTAAGSRLSSSSSSHESGDSDGAVGMTEQNRGSNRASSGGGGGGGREVEGEESRESVERENAPPPSKPPIPVDLISALMGMEEEMIEFDTVTVEEGSTEESCSSPSSRGRVEGRERKRETENSMMMRNGSGERAAAFIGKEKRSQKADDVILDTILTLLFAGHDTSAILITWLVKCLPSHPQVLRKLREEHDAVANDVGPDGPLTLQILTRDMSYTDKVINEGLRSNSPVPSVFRKALKDVEHNGYRIPKNSMVMLSFTPNAMNSDVFKNPCSFDPSNFDEPPPPFTFTPWGAGQRMCPGNEFARLETKVFLHHLVRKCDWVQVDPNEPLDTLHTFPKPSQGLPILVSKRQP